MWAPWDLAPQWEAGVGPGVGGWAPQGAPCLGWVSKRFADHPNWPSRACEAWAREPGPVEPEQRSHLVEHLLEKYGCILEGAHLECSKF